jgi:hypothetical protein
MIASGWTAVFACRLASEHQRSFGKELRGGIGPYVRKRKVAELCHPPRLRCVSAQCLHTHEACHGHSGGTVLQL